jgi:tetratricopeptide (TPR) repeat protein
MNGINFPSSIDLFNAILAGIVVSVTAGIINARIKNEIKTGTAIFDFFGLALVASLVFWSWYNAIGFAYYQHAANEEDLAGCGNAIYSYAVAIRWNPKIIRARWGLINCAVSLNRVESAISILEKQEDKLSDEPEYWEQMSFLSLKNNNMDKMLNALAIYSDMKPADVEDWTEAIGRSLMDQHMYPETESAMRVLQRVDTNKRAVFWLAWSMFEQQNYSVALENFDICIKNYESSSEVSLLGRCYAGKGFIYLNTGDTFSAKQAFIDAISIYPEQQDVKDALLKIP